jgi:hypothetical protein
VVRQELRRLGITNTGGYGRQKPEMASGNCGFATSKIRITPYLLGFSSVLRIAGKYQ